MNERVKARSYTFAELLRDCFANFKDNVFQFRLRIVEPIVTEFKYNFDNLMGFEKIIVNGTETAIEKGANIGLWVILGILALAGIGVGVFFYIKKKNSI